MNARPHEVHTAGNAVPPLDPELAGLLDDLEDVHDEGIQLLCDGIRHIAVKRLTVDKTQTLAVTLAGSPDGTDVLTAIGLLAARILNADSNPALRTLSLTAQKTTQLHGENLVRHLGDHELHQHASNASGAIHTD